MSYSPECKIQLSYPETIVKPLDTNSSSYFITTGVPFNLSFIDASNGISISGTSTKIELCKSSNTYELKVIHKSQSNKNIILLVPIINDDRATSSLSKYLNSDKDVALNLGADIGDSDVEYYSENNVIYTFVVKTPIKVKIPKGEIKNGITPRAGTPKLIKSTSLNDEVVCDYEGEDSDANKTPETKSDDWATALTLISCVAAFMLAYRILGSLPDNRDKALAGVGVISLISAIVMSVYAAKEKKARYTIGTVFCWALVFLTVWLKFAPIIKEGS